MKPLNTFGSFSQPPRNLLWISSASSSTTMATKTAVASVPTKAASLPAPLSSKTSSFRNFTTPLNLPTPIVSHKMGWLRSITINLQCVRAHSFLAQVLLWNIGPSRSSIRSIFIIDWFTWKQRRPRSKDTRASNQTLLFLNCLILGSTSNKQATAAANSIGMTSRVFFLGTPQRIRIFSTSTSTQDLSSAIIMLNLTRSGTYKTTARLLHN